MATDEQRRESQDTSPDEDRVLEYIRERLARGRRDYGPLRIDGDERDWLAEALEEALDQAIYLAIKILKLKDAWQK